MTKSGKGAVQGALQATVPAAVQTRWRGLAKVAVQGAGCCEAAQVAKSRNSAVQGAAGNPRFQDWEALVPTFGSRFQAWEALVPTCGNR